MPAAAVTAAEREPRRARYLIPRDTPRRGEVIAALTAAAVLGHLLFAQVTLVLAVAFGTSSRLSRWRPQWLAIPAAAGFLWVLAIGPGAALAGFAAGPRQVADYLASCATDPARIAQLTGAFAGAGHWLPRQLPLALLAGAAEAVVACWLSWLHTDEFDVPAFRPGLIILGRRRYTAAFVKSGGVVTRAGACLGLDQATGERAEVSWQEAAGGVLCTGAAGAAVAAASLQLVHAAIRRRKPVIAVDLTGNPALIESLAEVCAAAGAPLRLFGPAGEGYYEPLRGGDPARKTSLVMGMIDWAAVADHTRRTCGGYLNDLFAVAAAAPGDPAVPVIDDVVHLLSPAALRARMGRVPAYHPRRIPLAERVRVSASLVEADPAPAAVLAEQLTGLRAAALGRWLRPGPASAGEPGPALISLTSVVRERAVAFFPLDQAVHGRAAQMIANLVALDATAVFAQSRRLDLPGDALAWFGQCDVLGDATLADLISTGAEAGLAALFTTGSAPAAERIAGLANVLIIHRLADPGLAGRLAALTGTRLIPAESRAALPGATVPGATVPGAVVPDGLPSLVRSPVVPAADLCQLRGDEFTLLVKGPSRRIVPRGQFIPGSLG